MERVLRRWQQLLSDRVRREDLRVESWLYHKLNLLLKVFMPWRHGVQKAKMERTATGHWARVAGRRELLKWNTWAKSRRVQRSSLGQWCQRPRTIMRMVLHAWQDATQEQMNEWRADSFYARSTLAVGVKHWQQLVVRGTKKRTLGTDWVH